jgi:hypothetical protein
MLIAVINVPKERNLYIGMPERISAIGNNPNIDPRNRWIRMGIGNFANSSITDML